MSNDKIAKNLLEGASCTNCKHYENALLKCRILNPVEIKYPDDVQVFIGGMLTFQGEDANYSRVFILGNKVHFKQVDMPLAEFEHISIYSRGIDEDGKLDTEIHYISHRYKNMPDGSICEDWIKTVI